MPARTRTSRTARAETRPNFDIALIPVYWRNQERHQAYFKEVDGKEVERWAVWGEEAVAELKRRQQRRDPPGWYLWRFNDVVGWIRIYTESGLLHFGLYFKEGNRGRRTNGNVRVVDQSHAKVYPSMHPTSAEIAEAVVRTLREMSKESSLKGKFVDSTGFERMALFIDWRGLLRLDEVPNS